MRDTCYFGAETCSKGHTPGCPAIELHQSHERFVAFYGQAKAKATPMPSAGEEDTLPAILRPATSGAPAYGGYLQGGQVVTYPLTWTTLP